MKTDKELLELAAKAYNAGNQAWQCEDYQRGFIGNWNPLESDGDALRLAVKLGMLIHPNHGHVVCCSATGGFAEIKEPFGIDKFAAARRAIVRVAAAIGEKL